VPHALTGVSHSRPPVISFGTPLAGADSVLFAGDDAGWIAAVNARTGQEIWKTQAPVLPDPATVTGAPGAILSAFGGGTDRVLVGTRRNPSSGASDFLAIDPASPATRWVFSGGGTPFRSLGPVSGSPAVDNGRRRVYFASRRRAGGDTLWALDVTPTSLAYAWSLDPGGEFDGSPVLNYPRLYVGDTAGGVHSIDAGANPPTVPADVRSMSTLDGPVKGFLFPDRRSDDLFFATNTKVWSVSDTESGFVTNWTWTAPGLSPSVVLHWPHTSYLFFGGPDGKLYQLDFSHDPASPQFAKSVTLGDGAGRIGAPSLDVGVLPPAVSPGKKLLVVGSEASVLYGVEVPLE
jgi:outer membrane protein assembly factor BamB